MKKVASAFLFLVLSSTSFCQLGKSNFEQLIFGTDSVLVGTDTIGFLTSGQFKFNADTTIWGTWTGWAFSSMTDVKTPGFTNQFSAITGSGVYNSNAYAIATGNANVTFNRATKLTGTYINNTTYAYLDMMNGSGFSKKFGGESGNDPDSFVLRAYGYLNGSLQDSSDFYLADYTFSENEKDYAINKWTWWDLSLLGEIDSMTFTWFSSDASNWGINTPAYFAIDEFNGTNPKTELSIAEFNSKLLDNNGIYNGSDLYAGFYESGFYFNNSYNPTWGSWSGFALSNNTDTLTNGFSNQFSTYAGNDNGDDDNETFVVASAYGNNTIDLPFTSKGHTVSGFYATNNTYAALSMLNGDGFAKKFGGVSGDDKDYFLLKVNGIKPNGESTDTIAFYLADYRFEDNNQDYIVKDWTWVDLKTLGNIVQLQFSLESSDNGGFGMNTPAYFCIDDLNTTPVGLNSKMVSDLSFYPNPATDIIMLGNKDINKVEIFNSTGQQVFQNQHVDYISVSHLPNGVYTIICTQNNLREIGSFIKK
ncbi:MAG: DUF4465 domain-containing protein [Bacteroidia bacterium]